MTHIPTTAGQHTYPHDSAGRRMTKSVPVASETQTIGELHQSLSKHAADFKAINYIYVLDSNKHFIGVLSIRDIFTKSPSAKLGDVCKRNPLVYVHPEAHQERAAYLALRHNIKAVPVVDRNHVFVGEITADSVLTILHKEMHEDSMKRAGIRHPDAMHSSVLQLSLFTSFKHRIPWLLIGLLGGLLAARIIGSYEDTLSKNLILAAFIPLIVYMSDAVGTQMEAYIIRDLAIEKELPFGRYLLKHFSVVIAIGTFIAGLLFGAYGLFYGDWFVGAVLSLSLFAAVLSSVCTGLIVPWLFSRMKMDPADASGPVATVIQDILSIVIYFEIATLLLP